MNTSKYDMIFEAIEFATRAHRGQFRKGTNLPYIIHPIGVAKILIEHDCSEEVVVAGILHDLLEDTNVTTEDIKRIFGEQVARLVEGASEPNRNDSWEKRKLHTIKYLQTAPREVLLISCADKLDNIRSTIEEYNRVGEAVWQRFNRPREKQRWYNQALLEVYKKRINGEPGARLLMQFKQEVDKLFS